MLGCGGVLVPPADGSIKSSRESWVRVCYIDTHPDYKFTSRQLSLTVDHWWPRSQKDYWGLSTEELSCTHMAHRRCQDFQGGSIGGRATGPAKSAGARVGGLSGGKVTAMLHKSSGYFQSAEFRDIGNRGAATRKARGDYLSASWRGVGPHTRWHVNRGIVNPECKLCG